METLDQIFSSTVLNVLVPNTTLDFPPTSSTEEWLEKSKAVALERKQAFFDEYLQSLLVLRIKNPTPEPPEDPSDPPEVLLDLLAHIQVTLEASYISPNAPAPEPPRTSKNLQGTPRTSALAKANMRLNPHPSIIPPSTPHPVPSTGDQDRKYNTAEGTVLVANIWGSNTAPDSPEAFALLWSKQEEVWIAVYRMSITVSFLRLNFSNPLLSLTISATLREKPIPTHPQHPLALFLESKGVSRVPSPSSRDGEDTQGNTDSESKLLDGLEEVNLLEGLMAGTTFGKDPEDELDLPTLRLGTVSRQKLFLLPPVNFHVPEQVSPSPMTAVRKAHPTVRKSFRKVLQTASGFRVRMRTVFVPYVLLPETEGLSANLDEESKERERRDAGNDERTVVLCVEIENSGDPGATAGFLVEKVDVNIGGEGAKATLIGWGEQGLSKEAARTTFPLRIGPLAQYNLLYAVSFMRSPEENEAFSFARADNGYSPDLQRAVTINIFGKPYFAPQESSPSPHNLILDTLLYPTGTFPSRWNCVLDLAAQSPQPASIYDSGDPSAEYPNVMPEPASPFPGYGMYTSATNNSNTPGIREALATPQYSVSAGSRRFTMGASGSQFASRTLKALTPTKFLKPSDLNMSPGIPTSVSSRMSGNVSTLSSAAAYYMRSPTTFSAPPPPPPPFQSGPPTPVAGLPLPPDFDNLGSVGPATPTTPAYPPYPSKSALPPTPASQRPLSMMPPMRPGSAGGLSVEVRRDRGVGAAGPYGVPPQTPLPLIPGAAGDQNAMARLQEAGRSGENVVVSVGILPVERRGGGKGGEGGKHDSGDKGTLGPGRIYPMDVFTLDIFVFNQSGWPRRFEVTCPERRRRRGGGVETGVSPSGEDSLWWKMGYPGVLPLESRIRIGPLRTYACQSVRMDFLAVSPGVHSIDTLTLTDIETGYSTNLRSVMDIVVHDPLD
ncbi:hypothetical protein D9619_009948 [Psilocybe cf. subviscida]|uniref:Trafficking protein particle complex II-specific subunit 65 IgD3 domain-containing protein n=1 Tax=Psilocybe cf. subviscida TaxID=2480587 RepID=A0A8H5BLD4_9AGAR|nr:hypothetical protein D9619_009948 [Psilocybe cf. subviscida]